VKKAVSSVSITVDLVFLGGKLQVMLIYILKLRDRQSMKGGFPNLEWDG